MHVNSNIPLVIRVFSIVTCITDYRRGLDWRIDLLTTYRS
jgi:hypothetical protein